MAVDAEWIESIRNLGDDGSQDFLNELIDAYLEDGATKLGILRSAWNAREAMSLARTAHSLKGSSGIIGAARLAARCEAIERLARDGRLADLDPAMAALEDEFADVERALRSLRKGHEAG